MKYEFSSNAWSDYLFWQENDKKTLKKINSLLKGISRNYYEGEGNPEALKNNLSGYWSRRIDKKNRLVYAINEESDTCLIIQCKTHYNDK